MNTPTVKPLLLLTIFLATFSFAAHADMPDIAIPDRDIALIKSADFVEVTGTNMHGQPEDFTIHNSKAIAQFVALLTSERYIAVPKSLKPEFKTKSFYKVRLSSKGSPVLDLQIIGDSIIDLPDDPSYYMESDRHSDILLAPLLRLR